MLCSNCFTVLFCSHLLYAHSLWCLHFAAQSCSFPGSPAHSQVEFSDDSMESGTIASYTCERGFELLGPSRRVCDNGQWTPDGIPFCGKFIFILNFFFFFLCFPTSFFGFNFFQCFNDCSQVSNINAYIEHVFLIYLWLLFDVKWIFPLFTRLFYKLNAT